MRSARTGSTLWKPRDQTELDQIGRLVKSAIGFDDKRGDQLDVVSMPFVSALDAAEATVAPNTAKATGDLVTFLQMIAFGVVGFGIIILTARSIFAALNKQSVGLTIGRPAGEIADGGSPGIGLPQAGALGIGHSGGAQRAERARRRRHRDDEQYPGAVAGVLDPQGHPVGGPAPRYDAGDYPGLDRDGPWGRVTPK